jgi:hypothetical protein
MKPKCIKFVTLQRAMTKVNNLLSVFKFYIKCVDGRIEKERVLKALALSVNVILKLECSNSEAIEIPSVMENIFPNFNTRYKHTD